MTSDNKKKIKAERPRGFEDLSGEELLLQEKIINSVNTHKTIFFIKLSMFLFCLKLTKKVTFIKVTF